jgi:excisionase family DNA binding protein
VAKATKSVKRIRGLRGTSTPRAAATKPDARLLSAREVARRLGVSRGKTIGVLIDTGKIRTVVVNGRVKIPASEVERLTREGFDVTRSAPRRR